MKTNRTTFAGFLAQSSQGLAADSQLPALMADIAETVKAISGLISHGVLKETGGKTQNVNVQGETQTRLDVLTNEAFLKTFEKSSLVAGVVSEEIDDIHPIACEHAKGKFLVTLDPLDGSSNYDDNGTVGSIFSVLKAPAGRPPEYSDFLQSGKYQLAAGYAIYGTSTMLVITVGHGTHGFTLDRDSGEFVLTHPDMHIPEDTTVFAINASNERFWQPPVKKYINECKAGRHAVRGKDFNMRWNGCMVAEVHRILLRGGIYLYPQDTKDSAKPGRLRLMYEGNPMGMLVEQAGGIASTGRGRMLEVKPEGIHQLVSIVLGSRNEVERVERYHSEYDAGVAHEEQSPLFNDRSFYR